MRMYLVFSVSRKNNHCFSSLLVICHVPIILLYPFPAFSLLQKKSEMRAEQRETRKECWENLEVQELITVFLFSQK